MASISTVTQQLLEKGIPFTEGEPLKNHTTIKIGGPADVFCTPQNQEQLAQAVRAARDAGVPVFYLGQGSNLLFRDEGYRGMVLCLTEALGGIAVEGEALVAGAGNCLKAVCQAACDASLAGLEFAYGIPGSVGGAVYMDAGAFEGEIRQVLESVTYLDGEANLLTGPLDELQMDYRTSIFQTKPWCIVSARFKLRRGEAEMIQKLMQELMDYRSSKQPLELPSAGSAFKRPQGAFAGALIDQSGLRGYRVGDAAISEKHCGFIVNLGQATCQNVMDLADHVVATVKKKTGFVLEKEIQVVP